MSTVYNWGDRKIWLKIGMIQCIVSLSLIMEHFTDAGQRSYLIPLKKTSRLCYNVNRWVGDRKCAQVILVGLDANKSEKLKQTKALIF